MPSKKIESELDEVQLLFQHKQIDLCISKINKIIKNHKNEFLPYNYRGIIFLSLLFFALLFTYLLKKGICTRSHSMGGRTC